MNLSLDDPLTNAIRDLTFGAEPVICRVGDKEFTLNRWSLKSGGCAHEGDVFETGWDGPEVIEGLLSRARRITRWKYLFARFLRDLGHDLPRLPRWR